MAIAETEGMVQMALPLVVMPAEAEEEEEATHKIRPKQQVAEELVYKGKDQVVPEVFGLQHLPIL